MLLGPGVLAWAASFSVKDPTCSWDQGCALLEFQMMVAILSTCEWAHTVVQIDSISSDSLCALGNPTTRSGEDPFLGMVMVQPAVEGIQSKGVIANAKHFVNNNQ